MPKTRSKRARGNGDGSLAQDSKSGVWIARYADADGRRRKRSTGRTHRRDAEELLAKWTREVREIRDGLVDPDDLRRRDERARPLADHVRDYFESFTTKPRSKVAISVKVCVLRKLLGSIRDQLRREPRLSDYSPTVILRAMRARVEDGLSARTANLLRQNALALAAWITAEGRANLSDFSKRIPRFDESRDRRLVRRALTTEELARLFAAADERGRRLWYALAYYAGLRRGELRRATWGDVDFKLGTIAIRNRKAGRVDVLPLHQYPDLLEELRAARPLLAPAALSTSRIFDLPVHHRTREGDFARAGIPKVDADGRVADLHALRTTLGTNLARAGVPVQVAARAMRHTDPRTTQKHYTALGLVDVAQALSALPDVQVARATGTTDHAPRAVEIRGTSSGTSRRTNREQTARILEKPSTHPVACEETQTETLREDARRFGKPDEDVLHSLFRRAISSAG
jgi:integrase